MKKIGKWWFPDAEEQMRDEIDRNGMWHPHRLAAALRALPLVHRNPQRLRTVIDCGAHVGTWTCELAKIARNIWAFEPAEKTFRCLVHNVKEHVDSKRCTVNATRAAVGEHNGRGVSVTDDNYGEMNSGGNFVKLVGNEELQSVPVIDIDGLDLRDVDFFKIDVEGMEPYVLRGARETLLREHPLVVWENKPRFAARYGWDPAKEGPAAILTELGAKLLIPETAGKDEVWGWA